MRGGVSMATIRAAADSDVEVRSLDQENFTKLVSESEATKKELDRVAQERLKESLDLTKESHSD